MPEKDSILHQPVGELMRREISTDFLKKEIPLPEFLKKDIPLGFLDKEISLKRRERVAENPVIELETCCSCGKQTPATVSKCLHCDAHIEASYRSGREEVEPRHPVFEPAKSLIDLAEDIV